MKSFVALLILATVVLTQKRMLPILMVPGLGDSCSMPGFSSLVKQIENDTKHKTYCVDSAPLVMSFVRPFKTQVQKACEIIHENVDKWNLKNGFQMMGLSQGGITARGVLETCEEGQYMKGLFTMGGPHQGVASFPHTGNDFFSKLVNGVVDSAVYNSIVQNIIGPAGYFHRIDNEESYKESGCEISIMNNVQSVNADYANRIKNLDMFVMIMWKADTMIEPKESAHFGFYKDSSKTDTKDMTELDEYKNLGLDVLDKAGKIKRFAVEGDHMTVRTSDLQQYIYPNFL